MGIAQICNVTAFSKAENSFFSEIFVAKGKKFQFFFKSLNRPHYGFDAVEGNGTNLGYIEIKTNCEVVVESAELLKIVR